MLDSVTDYITDLPNITFQEYFVEYMMKVQDTNIDGELKQLLGGAISSLNRVDFNLNQVRSLNKLLSNTIEGLESI